MSSWQNLSPVVLHSQMRRSRISSKTVVYQTQRHGAGKWAPHLRSNHSSFCCLRCFEDHLVYRTSHYLSRLFETVHIVCWRMLQMHHTRIVSNRTRRKGISHAVHIPNLIERGKELCSHRTRVSCCCVGSKKLAHYVDSLQLTLITDHSALKNGFGLWRKRSINDCSTEACSWTHSKIKSTSYIDLEGSTITSTLSLAVQLRQLYQLLSYGSLTNGERNCNQSTWRTIIFMRSGRN